MARFIHRLLLSSVVLVLGPPAAAGQDAVAQARARRVALVAPGAELVQATRAALEPWGLSVVVIAGPAPGPIAPDNNQAARALAEAEGVDAVAWVSQHAGRHALWVYDRESHHAIERALPQAPPFDAASAAAIALTVKTLLRHSAAAPDSERYGAQADPTAVPAPSAPNPAAPPAPNPAAPPAPNPAAPPAPTQTSAQPSHAGAALELAGAGASEPLPPPARDAPAPMRAPPVAPVHALQATTPASELADTGEPEVLLAWLRGGVRLGATRPAALSLRGLLGVTYWPGAGDLGLGLAGGVGPRQAMRSARFEGQLLDAEGRASLCLRHALSQRARALVGLDGVLHFLSLAGRVLDAQRDVSALRVSPAVALWLQAEWRLVAGLRVGLFGEVALLAKRERYYVEDAVVAEVLHLRASAGLGLSLPLH